MTAAYFLRLTVIDHVQNEALDDHVAAVVEHSTAREALCEGLNAEVALKLITADAAPAMHSSGDADTPAANAPPAATPKSPDDPCTSASQPIAAAAVSEGVRPGDRASGAATAAQDPPALDTIAVSDRARAIVTHIWETLGLDTPVVMTDRVKETAEAACQRAMSLFPNRLVCNLGGGIVHDVVASEDTVQVVVVDWEVVEYEHDHVVVRCPATMAESPLHAWVYQPEIWPAGLLRCSEIVAAAHFGEDLPEEFSVVDPSVAMNELAE